MSRVVQVFAEGTNARGSALFKMLLRILFSKCSSSSRVSCRRFFADEGEESAEFGYGLKGS